MYLSSDDEEFDDLHHELPRKAVEMLELSQGVQEVQLVAFAELVLHGRGVVGLLPPQLFGAGMWD